MCFIQWIRDNNAFFLGIVQLISTLFLGVLAIYGESLKRKPKLKIALDNPKGRIADSEAKFKFEVWNERSNIIAKDVKLYITDYYYEGNDKTINNHLDIHSINWDDEKEVDDIGYNTNRGVIGCYNITNTLFSINDLNFSTGDIVERNSINKNEVIYIRYAVIGRNVKSKSIIVKITHDGANNEHQNDNISEHIHVIEEKKSNIFGDHNTGFTNMVGACRGRFLILFRHMCKIKALIEKIPRSSLRG
ncbi:MAG: hypothetical protein WCU00_08630 [Candidatus Latescibacterota bacterium]